MTGSNIDKMIEFTETVEGESQETSTTSHRRLGHTQSTQTGRRMQH